MENELTNLFALLSVDPTVFAATAATVYFLVKAIKEKIPNGFFTGFKTEALTIFISFVMSWLNVQPTAQEGWISVIFLTGLIWLVPAGIHKSFKKE